MSDLLKHDRRRTLSRRLCILLGATVLSFLTVPTTVEAANCARNATGNLPLTDLRDGTYQGYTGWLYPGRSNTPPSTHISQGLTLAHRTVPRTPAGAADLQTGKLVFLSIGMSNARDEFNAFIPLARADIRRSPRVVVVNGAIGGASADEVADASDPYWAGVDHLLSQAGVTGKQVGAVWLKEAEWFPNEPFPADAQILKDHLSSIARILKQRFPNLWLVYVSSRIYAGYAATQLNPEPYAYQSGFAVKWLIGDQIQGRLPVGATSAPWLAWGPYLWADGTRARSDGLIWSCADFTEDGVHLTGPGASKVAKMILDFVHADGTTRIWYEGKYAQ